MSSADVLTIVEGTGTQDRGGGRYQRVRNLSEFPGLLGGPDQSLKRHRIGT